MTLHDLDSPEAVETFRTSNPNVLICFSATWCGPCQKSKPTLMDLAAKYESGELSRSHDLKVGIAYEHDLGDALHAKYGVKAFPTYVLWTGKGSKEEGRVEGANFDGIRKLIEAAGCRKEMGEGHSLGGGVSGGDALSAAEARAKRLEKLEAAAASSPAPAQDVAKEEAKPKEEEKATPMEEDAKPSVAAPADDAASTDVEMKDADGDAADDKKEDAAAAAEPEMVDPTEALDVAHVTTLTESMGFSEIRAQKGLLKGNGSVEGAVEWLMAHQDDDDIDAPIEKVPKAGATAQSYKCNECGKVMANMANLELHANKTGHSDFEESTEAVKPLTAEEKAAKILEIKALLKAKRNEREDAEKEDNKEKEKQRRFMGKEMAKTKEELDRAERKRDAKARKREKDASKRERERIRAELAKDKAERIANKGKLHSKLGAGGYNPDAIQYNVSAGGAAGAVEGEGKGKGKEEGGAAATEDAHSSPAAKKHRSAAVGDPSKIDEYIKKVSGYRAGGDGKNCLKILLAYVKNVVDKPDEEKFRTIKMDNKVYKTKVKPFLGARNLLTAAGFVQTEDGTKMVLRDDADRDLLAGVRGKLEEAYGKL